MWLDTMAPTTELRILNSFNFSAALNFVWKGKWFKMNSQQYLVSIETLTNGNPVLDGFSSQFSKPLTKYRLYALCATCTIF